MLLLFSIRVGRLAVLFIARVLMLQIVEVQHDIGFSTQIALEPVQCHPHDVAVVYLSAARNAAHLHPQLVYQTDILFSKVRRVRA